MQITHITDTMKAFLGDMYEPLTKVFQVIGILIITMIIVNVGSIIIKKLFKKNKIFASKTNIRRMETMSTLMVSMFRYLVYITAGIMILTDVLKMNSILAAASIGGVAIGFGAQSLIKDMISGIFIVFEDQFAVGDIITIDNMSGTVEEMELRVTKIRSMNGDLHIIPNGEIKRVTNQTRGNKIAIVDIPLSYNTEIAKAMEIANAVCQEVQNEFETIVEPPEVLGLTELGKESMNLRIMAKSIPIEHWKIERRIRMRIQEEFNKNGIEFYDVRTLPVTDSKAKESK